MRAKYRFVVLILVIRLYTENDKDRRYLRVRIIVENKYEK